MRELIRQVPAFSGAMTRISACAKKLEIWVFTDFCIRLRESPCWEKNLKTTYFWVPALSREAWAIYFLCGQCYQSPICGPLSGRRSKIYFTANDWEKSVRTDWHHVVGFIHRSSVLLMGAGSLRNSLLLFTQLKVNDTIAFFRYL